MNIQPAGLQSGIPYQSEDSDSDSTTTSSSTTLSSTPPVSPSSSAYSTISSDSSELAEISTPAVFSGHLVSDVQPPLKKGIADTEGTSHGSRKRPADLSESESVKRRKVYDYTITTGDPIVSRLDTKASPYHNYDRVALRYHFAALSTITVPHQHLPKSMSNAPLAEQFAENTVRRLQLTNTPYAKRNSVETSYYAPRDVKPGARWQLPEKLTTIKRLGIFYAQDYQARELPGFSNSRLLGVHSLPKYFDRERINSFVEEGSEHTPSECLNAFFHGPTIAECATTLLACMYRAIETTIGTDQFNRIFGTPVSTFRIARSLFQDSGITLEDLPDRFGDIQPIDITNPLYCLFDDLQFMRQSSSDPVRRKLSESDIKKGDILYISGIENYCAKHKFGDHAGYNLICTGQNSSGQNLYLGFDPDNFGAPKTYDQVKNILIDNYNKPQSCETIAAIKRGESSYAQLTDHILPHDHPIVGITAALRFSVSRWKYFASQYDRSWHQQPLLSVPSAVVPKSVDHGSPFPSENIDADFDHFEPGSPQQELMKLTALKFTHAVINNLGEARHKKPMGLFLAGSPGIGKTHLCVAVAKKAAEYGVNTLYIDAIKVCNLIQDFAGDETRWENKVEAIFAGKDLLVIDDVNHELGCAPNLLTKAMKHVLTANAAVMVSSNHPVPVKDATSGFIDPLTENAHNFICLSDLQGESRRCRWWQSPEVQATDALSQLGQYQGCKSAAVITENTLLIDDIVRALNISVGKIRRVGHYFWPGVVRLSPDFYFSDLSRTKHQAVFMECHIVGDEFEQYMIEQFLNVIQRVHDEGLKMVIKTNNRQQFVDAVLGFLNESNSFEGSELRIIDRLKHMCPDFS